MPGLTHLPILCKLLTQKLKATEKEKHVHVPRARISGMPSSKSQS